jgi:hypothetical protein
MSAPRLERRLRISGVLIALGLLTEAASLVRIHPLAFLSLMFIGGGFLAAGIVTYLLALVSLPSSPAGK